MFSTVKSAVFILLAITGFMISSMGLAVELVPPPYDVVNRHFVSMVSGRVSPKQTDITIGGSMGLSHTISSYTSNFVNYEVDGQIEAPWGFNDNFRGALYKTKKLESSIPSTYVRAAGGNGSSLFAISADGKSFSADADYLDLTQTDGTYLEFQDKPAYYPTFTGYVYTLKNGTRVYYKSGDGSSSFANGLTSTRIMMTGIDYPNGLRVNVIYTPDGAVISSVTTNTGFQLKYIRKQDLTPVSCPGSSSTSCDLTGWWSGLIPKYIMAINNAVDYCTTAENDRVNKTTPALACPNMSKVWPYVTYTFPIGMPTAMYKSEGSFTVTDAEGLITEYKHKPYNGIIDTANKYVPRLVAIKYPSNPNGTGAVTINYDYKTDAITENPTDMFPWFRSAAIAQLARSWSGMDSMGYLVNQPARPGEGVNMSNGYKPINSLWVGQYGISNINSWDKTVVLQTSETNRIKSISETVGGSVTNFTYDTRGNVTASNRDGLVTTAEYPATCTSATRKTCNQATWIADPKGNKTEYTYHAESGQVESITLPADKNGVRAQTRNTYEAKYATYKMNGNTLEKATSPIWLLTKESKCQLAAPNATVAGTVAAGCLSNSEVVTVYDYGPTTGANNLLLRGITVTALNAQNVRESRRTCYSYDHLGNRIDETTPNAQPTSCY